QANWAGKFHGTAKHDSRGVLVPVKRDDAISTRWDLDYFASGDRLGACPAFVRFFRREISEGTAGKKRLPEHYSSWRPEFRSHDRDGRHCFARNDRRARATQDHRRPPNSAGRSPNFKSGPHSDLERMGHSLWTILEHDFRG